MAEAKEFQESYTDIWKSFPYEMAFRLEGQTLAALCQKEFGLNDHVLVMMPEIQIPA